MATTIDLGRVVGADGITFTPEIGTVTTLTAGENAAASVQAIASQARAVFSFSLPRGADGPDGADGVTYTPEIGTVTTLSAGSDATVSVQAIASQARAVFSFGIPRGANGSGAGGGFSGAVYTPEIGTVTTLSAGSDATVSLQTIASQGRAIFSFGIPRGANGSGAGGGFSGAVYTPEIGTVTTLSAGSDATVSLQTIASQGRAVFSFGIPRGSAGSGGAAATILITFSANMAGGTYTVTDGEGESYTAAVPPSLVDALSVRSLNTVYTVTCQTALGDTFEKTVTTGASSGTCPCDISTHIYGFHIDPSESDPSDAVTYLEDAAGLTPAAMNFSTGVFNYGSWENAFFMPRPCMLKYDGTVDYYLDPDDYTKKAGGVTASDVANGSYGGNAMMEWGRDGRKIWYKIVPDAGDDTGASVYIADHQADSDYHCWSFINSQGEIVPHFYTAIYSGWLDNSQRLRSISGKSTIIGRTMSATIQAAELNDPSTDRLWHIETLCDDILITLLLTLLSKSLDSQACFGMGLVSGSESSVVISGGKNSAGLFSGSSNSDVPVKVFGMENWWGNQFRFVAGLIDSYGTEKYKLTRGTQDGSAAGDYNTTGDGYLTGLSSSLGNGSFIQQCRYDGNHFSQVGAGGTSSTYYCDYSTMKSDAVYIMVHGGTVGSGANSGAWCYYSISATDYNWRFTSALSCKPLAEE